MAYIIDGKTIAKKIRDKVKTQVNTLPSTPGLAVLLVGDDPASRTYVAIKGHASTEAGIRFELFTFKKDVDEQVLLDTIKKLNERNDIHGILVQLPLPKQNADNVIDAIDPKKDVDGFHPANIDALKAGHSAIVSAVALAVMKLLEHAHTLQRKSTTATIVSGRLFAEPLIALLKNDGIDAVVIDPNKFDKTNTDIVIVAAGRPGLITGNTIKVGAIVIDVGTTKINGTLRGDVDFESAKKVAAQITPVPGGVGPMTVAMLLVNVLKAYRLQQGDAVPTTLQPKSQPN